MDSRDMEVLSGFAEVWARVMDGASREQDHKEPDFVQQVMDRLYGLCLAYTRLGRSSRGGIRCSLQALAGETQRAFHWLQVAYFLESGELYHPMETERFASCTMSNLRKLWKNTSELMQMLQLHPRDAGNLFGVELAAVEKLMAAHKDRLKCIIGAVME